MKQNYVTATLCMGPVLPGSKFNEYKCNVLNYLQFTGVLQKFITCFLNYLITGIGKLKCHRHPY